MGPNGKPVMTVGADGATGRSITIYEHIINKKRTWGVEFKPGIEAFTPLQALPGEEIDEPVQILADVITGLMRQIRTNKAQARAKMQVQHQLNQINEQERK